MMQEMAENLGEIPEIEKIHLDLKHDEADHYKKLYQKLMQSSKMWNYLNKLGKLDLHEAI